MAIGPAETTLELRGRGRREYELPGVGMIRTLRYWNGEVSAGGVTWTLRRSHVGFRGQLVDGEGQRVGDVGVSHLRGSTLHVGERTLELRSKGLVRTRFYLSEGGQLLAVFRPGYQWQPLRATVEDLARVDPLVLLLCCLLLLHVKWD